MTAATAEAAGATLTDRIGLFREADICRCISAWPGDVRHRRRGGTRRDAPRRTAVNTARGGLVGQAA